MRVYRERDRLKTESVSVLTGAYRALTDKRVKETTQELPFDLADLGCGVEFYSLNGENRMAWIVPSDNVGYVFYALLECDSFDGYTMVGCKKAIRKDRVLRALRHYIKDWSDIEALPIEPGDTWAGPLKFNAMLYESYEEYLRGGLGIR